jgi:hypothetical protein
LSKLLNSGKDVFVKDIVAVTAPAKGAIQKILKSAQGFTSQEVTDLKAKIEAARVAAQDQAAQHPPSEAVPTTGISGAFAKPLITKGVSNGFAPAIALAQYVIKASPKSSSVTAQSSGKAATIPDDGTGDTPVPATRGIHFDTGDGGTGDVPAPSQTCRTLACYGNGGTPKHVEEPASVSGESPAQAVKNTVGNLEQAFGCSGPSCNNKFVDPKNPQGLPADLTRQIQSRYSTPSIGSGDIRAATIIADLAACAAMGGNCGTVTQGNNARSTGTIRHPNGYAIDVSFTSSGQQGDYASSYIDAAQTMGIAPGIGVNESCNANVAAGCIVHADTAGSKLGGADAWAYGFACGVGSSGCVSSIADSRLRSIVGDALAGKNVDPSLLPGGTVSPTGFATKGGQYAGQLAAAEQKYALPQGILGDICNSETGCDPSKCNASGSSACGMFQYTNSTWQSSTQQMCAAGAIAASQCTYNGGVNPASRTSDPGLSIEVAAHDIASNLKAAAASIAQSGIDQKTAAYMMQGLGLPTAQKFFQAYSQNPNQSTEDFIQQVNPSQAAQIIAQNGNIYRGQTLAGTVAQFQSMLNKSGTSAPTPPPGGWRGTSATPTISAGNPGYASGITRVASARASGLSYYDPQTGARGVPSDSSMSQKDFLQAAREDVAMERLAQTGQLPAGAHFANFSTVANADGTYDIVDANGKVVAHSIALQPGSAYSDGTIRLLADKDGNPLGADGKPLQDGGSPLSVSSDATLPKATVDSNGNVTFTDDRPVQPKVNPTPAPQPQPKIPTVPPTTYPATTLPQSRSNIYSTPGLGSGQSTPSPLSSPILSPLLTPQLSCLPASVTASSTPITIRWSCIGGTPISNGFSTGGLSSGQTLIPVPSNVSSTRSSSLQFGLFCILGTQRSPVAMCSVAVQPSANAAQPGKTVVSIIANPSTIAKGATSKLSWTSANASACTVTSPSGLQIGPLATSSTATTPALSVTTVFTATCTASSSTPAVATTTVTVQ